MKCADSFLWLDGGDRELLSTALSDCSWLARLSPLSAIVACGFETSDIGVIGATSVAETGTVCIGVLDLVTVAMDWLAYY